MDALCIRFHYRGRLEWHDLRWIYIGGRSSCSVVPVSNLSVAQLKRHLADHVAVSDEDLQDTTLTWRLTERESNVNCMCTLVDDTNVSSMVRHVIREADGDVEIFAIMPEKSYSSDEEEEQPFHLEEQQQIGQEEQQQHVLQEQQQVVLEEQQQEEQQQVVLEEQQQGWHEIELAHESGQLIEEIDFRQHN